ncbi:MAG: DUF2628 domain-containing protein [Clostridia bacterium]|nr:DUF2628 domain-containing protein [Clostridia bacterium]
MDYKNEVCKGCNQPIKENDDIVVCPVCGTPQHRSCWVENGECANTPLHKEGYVWQKTQPDEPTVTNLQTGENNADSSPVLGSIPVFEQLSQEAQNLETVFLRDQFAHKDEEFDGVSVIDAGYYLQSGAHRYIKRFRKGKKITWNWGAFFFAPAWFFYRRLYKFGAIFLALVVSVNLFSYSFLEKIDIQMQEVYTVMGQYIAEDGNTIVASDEMMADEEFMTLYTNMVKNMSIYLLITAIIPNTVAALFADTLVKKKMKEDIAAAKEASDELQMQRSLIISKGGVAPLIFAIVYFVNQYLVSILINIGSVVAEWFN